MKQNYFSESTLPSLELNNDENLNENKKLKKFLATDATLNNPHGVFVTPNDEVFIADSENHRVRKILQDGTIVTIAGNGKEGFSGDGGPATDAELNFPSSVFVSPQNEVYIVDIRNFRIRKITTDGTIITIAGNGEEGFSGDNGPAINAQISYIESIYVSEHDEVYLADRYNFRIRKILKNGNIITIAGNGEDKYAGDGVIATETGLNNPSGVFVSQNGEIYISAMCDNCITKIKTDGTIIRIAGTGDEGFSGDGGLAINAELFFPACLVVSSNDEVYFVDDANNIIRKIMKNGIIETVVGNGEYGFSGDNGPAINAELLMVKSLYISKNDELYFSDSGNNRIRKVLKNGTIITIAGNGEKGYNGDSLFDFSKNPHIGCCIDMKLRKYSRDEINGLELIGFLPLIEKVSPQFCQIILKNEMILKSMNAQQLKIIQKLIDSLIYEISSTIYGYYDVLDALFILGMFKNYEFITLKRKVVSQFIQTITLETLQSKLEQVQNFIEICKELSSHNYILEYLNNYCLEYASTTSLNIKDESLKSFPMEEEIEIESKGIESLFNEEKTSDVKIKMGNKYLYCHKTILSSKSLFFKALFESGSTFSDLSHDGIFTPDESQDLNLLEIVIKSCYEIQVEEKMDYFGMCKLLELAIIHEIQLLIEYFKCNLEITTDNYFEIVSDLEKYFDFPIFEKIFDELINFGIENKKNLFAYNYDKLHLLPQKFMQELVRKLSK